MMSDLPKEAWIIGALTALSIIASILQILGAFTSVVRFVTNIILWIPKQIIYHPIRSLIIAGILFANHQYQWVNTDLQDNYYYQQGKELFGAGKDALTNKYEQEKENYQPPTYFEEPTNQPTRRRRKKKKRRKQYQEPQEKITSNRGFAIYLIELAASNVVYGLIRIVKGIIFLEWVPFVRNFLTLGIIFINLIPFILAINLVYYIFRGMVETFTSRGMPMETWNDFRRSGVYIVCAEAINSISETHHYNHHYEEPSPSPSPPPVVTNEVTAEVNENSTDSINASGDPNINLKGKI